ncbi:MAG: hypothetical protein M3P49_14165 [Actinomycetota bacterium]|nr:hypothetical protein [Actinomycetota bacterium]
MREARMNKVVEAVRGTVARDGAGGLAGALAGLTLEELEQIKVQTDAALWMARRERREEDSERRAALREMAAMGEALVWEMIHCGNCKRCGYRKHGPTDASVRPHGPYPFLWSWGRRGRLVKKYVKRTEVVEVKERLRVKRERSRRAREELRRARRSGSANPAMVEEIERMDVYGTLDEEWEVNGVMEAVLEVER